MGKTKAQLRIGTSGYQYKHWKGVFYPEELRTSDWFRFYAERFDTVEINNTFYHLPEAKVFDAWRERAPAGFCFVLKFSRYGSHLKKLKNPHASIGSFLERADRLGKLLGPILVQLPPGWSVNAQRLSEFLEVAPPDHRWAFEFRDPSWLCEEVFGILRAHRAALCIHDMIPDHPRPETTGWIYLRFHGQRYTGSYSEERLASEAKWIRPRLAEGKDVFAYFNNDAGGHAIHNALDLRRLMRNDE